MPANTGTRVPVPVCQLGNIAIQYPIHQMPQQNPRLMHDMSIHHTLPHCLHQSAYSSRWQYFQNYLYLKVYFVQSFFICILIETIFQKRQVFCQNFSYICSVFLVHCILTISPEPVPQKRYGTTPHFLPRRRRWRSCAQNTKGWRTTLSIQCSLL